MELPTLQARAGTRHHGLLLPQQSSGTCQIPGNTFFQGDREAAPPGRAAPASLPEGGRGPGGSLAVGRGGTRHTYSLWLERGLDLLALQLVPVDVAEERVLLDVPLPLRAAAQALGGVLGHQLGTGERKQSRGVQLLPKMSPLRSPQRAVFPSWTSQDVSHQGPISSRCLWGSKERTLRKKLE